MQSKFPASTRLQMLSMRVRTRHIVGILTLSLACAEAIAPPPTVSVPQQQAWDLGTSRGMDRILDSLSALLPELAGVYRDSAGALHVVVTDVAKGDRARSLVRDIGKPRRRGGTPSATEHNGFVELGDYRFRDLLRWKRELSRGIAGTYVTMDADERRNRVVVGLRSEIARGTIEKRIASLGIPLSAILLESASAVVPAQQQPLADYWTPFMGGIPISTYPNHGSGPALSHCTLGFNATRWRDGAWRKGFVIPSHCTQQTGVYDGTSVRVGNPYSHGLGFEVADPGSITSCAGTLCRVSDAAFIEYSVPIMREPEWPSAFAMMSYVPFDPAMPHAPVYDMIISTPATAYPFVGLPIYKTGASSGVTGATISQTCVEIVVGTKHFLCENRVDGIAQSGDSGAPVFGWHPQGGWVVYGMLTYTCDPSAQSQVCYYFSSFDSIQAELSELRLYDYVFDGGGGGPWF